MKKKKDIVDKGIDALKNEPVPHGPPEQAVDAVITKLAEASGVPPPGAIREGIRAISFTRIAAAAVVLIVAGFAVGRLTSPRPPDMEELHCALETSLKSSLEPSIRQDLLEELKKCWQLALASSYVQLKDEVGRQLRSDMNEFGVQVLAASGTVTDRRLTELIEAIDAAQTQERRWIAAALEQMEFNRQKENSELRNDFVSFAVQTGDELARTKQDMAQFLTYTQPGKSVPDE
ncbi:MAG: hypothetical protein ACYSW4_05720 [Planctomycetota bacterium]|jgi:hypothetical protein